MKKLLILPLIIISFLSGCKKDTPMNPNDDQQLNTSVQNKGTAASRLESFDCENRWSITHYERNGIDQSFRYRDFYYHFCPDQSSSINNPEYTFAGSWQITGEKNDYFNIDFDFNGEAGWPELEGQWKILSMQEDAMSLELKDGNNIAAAMNLTRD